MNDRCGSRPGGGVFDPGLQPERTDLAWRRTTLALAVGAVLALRVLPPVLGVWSLVAALAGFALTAVIGLVSGRRARTTRQALLRGAPPPHAAVLMLFLALTTAAGGSLGMLYVALL